MITITNLRLQRGQKVLLESANARVDIGQRVGVIGRNGTGKSSLFALLRGELHGDAGDVSIPSNWVIAHVAQEMPETEMSALDYVLEGDEELMRLKAELKIAEEQNDGVAIAHCHSEWARIDAYSAPARAGQLLNGLGFAQSLQGNPVNSFSGGWRMRLNLARALMCRSELLLLDEPTNHLDLDTVLWLEQYLKSHPATQLIISHDRDFLDTLCTHIIEVAQQTLTSYKGNYTQFERIRGERLAQQQALYAQQQRHIAHLQSYIDRFRAKATKARQAQSRIKALDRLELVAAAHLDSPFTFEFAELHDLPNPLMQTDGIQLGYGDKTLLDKVAFSIQSHDRIGLLGMNGAGKSTLIKALAQELTPLSGSITTAQNLRIGYFSQQHLDTLREDESPLWHMQRLAPNENVQVLRNFLGGFHFQGDRVIERITNFSGGEKARLALALLIWQKPHLLLLDEPTNHLDLDMRHALTVALQQFNGALIVVSHDRSLLANCVDDFWLVANGTVKPFDGDLEDYRAWCAKSWQLYQHDKNQANAQESLAESQSNVNKREARQQATQNRIALANAQKPLKQQLAKLEKTLHSAQTEHSELQNWLASESAYAPEHKDSLAEKVRRTSELSAQIEALEEEWLLLHEQLEAIENEMSA
ncbi:MAG: ATP-binding cassette domain-containing protein [Burkholderiales bacterium]|nr:ATP-binding cassette domain-containing protein [Burkholderiales bacterium]